MFCPVPSVLLAGAIALTFPLPVAFGQDDLLPDGASRVSDGAAARVVQGGGVMITWSEDNGELRGFSQETGKWRTLSVDPVEKVDPVVTDDVAAVVLGSRVAAFSAKKTRWDVLTLSGNWDADASPVVVSPGLVQVQDGPHIYTFAASNAHWTSPTDEEYQSTESVYELKHVSSGELHRRMEEWLQSQDPSDVHGGANFTGRAVTIFANRKSWKDSLEDFLTSVDVPDSAASTLPRGLRGHQRQTQSIADPKVEGLRRRLQEQEQKAAAVARELMETESPSDEQRSQLTDLVQAAFDSRQQLQLADVARMEKKLQTIRENLKARQSNRDRIVQRRVEELLDPKGTLTRWSTPAAAGARAVGKPVTGSAIGFAGPAGLPGGAGASAKPAAQGQMRATASLDIATPGSPLPRSQQTAALTELASQLRNLRVKVQQARTKVEEAAQQKADLESMVARLPDPDALDDDARRDATVDIMQAQNSLNVLQKVYAAQKNELDASRADWKGVWAAYQTELRLRQLDVEEARAVLKPLVAELERVQRLSEQGLVSKNLVQEAESKVALAKIGLERAERVLALVTEVIVREPELNPDAEAETRN